MTSSPDTVHRGMFRLASAIRQRSFFFLMGFGCLWLSGCTPMQHETTQQEEASKEGPSGQGTSVEPTFQPCQDAQAHWTYTTDDQGPEHWADLSRCFALCEAGLQQSPIDLEVAQPAQLPELRFLYAPAPLRLQNNGHTIELSHDGKSALDFGEMTFTLRQIHFHAPSEHTRGGEASPLEMHLVHSSSGGAMAVVGIFIEPGDDNPGLGGVWQHLPTTPGESQDIEDAELETAALLPKGHASYRYAGSLTTPPCSEGIRWIILDEAITLSQEKIDLFTAIYSDNRRPTQPLGDRLVESDV